MAALTPALTALQSRLGTTSPYSLNVATLAGPTQPGIPPANDLFAVLQAYLQIPATGAFTIAGQPPANVNGQLVLSGSGTVLGIANAQIVATFIDAIGGDNADARGIDLVVTITPASGTTWKFSQSFSQLAGTLLDNLTLTSPSFILCSQANLPVTPPGASAPVSAAFGLSFAASVMLTGPLQRVATLAGSGVPVTQPVYGPIAFTTDTQPLPLLDLDLPPLSFTLPGFPSPVNLTVSLQTAPASPSAVSANIFLSVPMSIAGVGTMPLAGVLPATGAISLLYDLLSPSSVTVNNLNPWGSTQPVSNALPAALRSATFQLVSASMTLQDNPRQVSSTSFALTTSSNWTLGSGFTLAGIQAVLSASSPQAISAAIAGYVPIADSSQPNTTTGIGAGATSDAGFTPPFSVSLISPQPAGVSMPSLKALVAAAYSAWSNALPSDLVALGAAIQMASFAVTVGAQGTGVQFTANATNVTAAWSLLATPLPLALTQLSVQVSAPYGASPTGTVSGSMGLGSPAQATPFQTVVTGASFTAYTFTLQSTTLTVGPLSASLCGPGTRAWIAALPLASGGTLAFTPGNLASLTGSFSPGQSTWDVPPAYPNTFSQLQGITGPTMSVGSGTVAMTLAATWQIRQMSPYQGTLPYDYTQFMIDNVPMPIPEEANPKPKPPNPITAEEVIGYVFAAAGTLIVAGVVGAAIYATYQTSGYSVAGAGGLVWTRLLRYTFTPRSRAILLFGGILLVNVGISFVLLAQKAKQASNNDIGPTDGGAGLQSVGASARDAGDALAQTYSLDPSGVAQALAPSYPAAETAAALRQLYPDTYPTASSMITQLTNSNVYGSSLTPREMTAALAAAGYPVTQIAPAVLQQYPTQVGTAASMAPVLQGGFQDANVPLLAPSMASGLAACGFGIVPATVAEVPLYTSVSLNDMAAALVSGYQTVAPPSGMQLAIALATAGQSAAPVQTAVMAALPGLTTDQWTAIAAVAFDAGEAALLALAEQQKANNQSAMAAVQTIVATQPAVTVNAVTGVIYAVYSPPNLTAPVLGTAITQGYGTNPPSAATLTQAILIAQAPAAQSARTMTAILAAAGYPIAQIAVAVSTQYPQTAGTAALLAPTLQLGYQDAGLVLSSADMAKGLAASAFSLLQSTVAMAPLYTTRPLPGLATDIVAAWQTTAAPASAMQLMIALAAAGNAAAAVAPAVLAAMPTITASQMAALLFAAYDTSEPAALTLAQQQQGAGQTAAQAAAAIVLAQAQIAPAALAGVLYTVYSPPAIVPSSLATDVVAGFGTSTDSTALGVALPLCYLPAALTATVVAQALVGALPALTAVQVATALKAAGYSRTDALAALLASGFPQAQAQQAIVQVYGGTAVNLIGNASCVQIPSLALYTIGVGDFSIEIWVQANTAQGGVLVCHMVPSPQIPAGYKLEVTTGSFIAVTMGAAGGSAVTCQTTKPVTIFDGKSHYVAAVRQTTGGTTTMTIYADGQAIAASPSQPPLIDVSATQPLYVGAPDVSQGLGISWQGIVWNVCLWNVALAAATVAQHAAAGTVLAPQPGLVGNWPFTDDATDDQSGNNNNGTLQGGATIVPPPGD